MKKHIISITGDLASGKGTVSSLLISRLNYTVYRNGEAFRNMAKEHGMDVIEFNEYVDQHPEIDKQIEAKATEFAETHDNFVIDARLGWYAIPNSFKVYLKVDPDVAAERAYCDERRKSTENYKTIQEQKESLHKRSKLERERYKRIYGVELTDMNNYDCVIDTTEYTPQVICERIIEKYNLWLED